MQEKRQKVRVRGVGSVQEPGVCHSKAVAWSSRPGEVGGVRHGLGRCGWPVGTCQAREAGAWALRTEAGRAGERLQGLL